MSHIECSCSECGKSGEVFLHSRCHAGEPTWTLLKGNTITIQCSVCEAVVCRFLVASGPYAEVPQ